MVFVGKESPMRLVGPSRVVACSFLALALAPVAVAEGGKKFEKAIAAKN
jgi:hypothetical protein